MRYYLAYQQYQGVFGDQVIKGTEFASLDEALSAPLGSQWSRLIDTKHNKVIRERGKCNSKIDWSPGQSKKIEMPDIATIS